MKPNTNESAAGTSRSPGGFSLIEMLAVILIIGVLVAASASFFGGSMSALRLTTDGTQVEAMLSAAQQAASAEGRNIEVRFYKHEDGQQLDGERYRSIVLLRYYQAGESDPDPNGSRAPLKRPLAVVMGDTHTMAAGIVLTENDTMSSLLGTGTSPSAVIDTKVLTKDGLKDWEFGVKGATYHSFVLRPEGTSLDPKQKWFVTVVSARDEEKSAADAKNFYCVQIDPGNGRVTSYRP